MSRSVDSLGVTTDEVVGSTCRSDEISRERVSRLATENGYRTVPRGYRYADHIPYVTPDSLDDLKGPTKGTVTVGPHIDTSVDPTYDLRDPDRLRNMYTRVVRDGFVPDHVRFLDRRILVKLWPSLDLPTRCRTIWESRFPELAVRTRRTRAA
jgi:hypothetical protein